MLNRAFGRLIFSPRVRSPYYATAAVSAAAFLALACAAALPAAAQAENLNSFVSAGNGGAMATEGGTIYRSDTSNFSTSWDFRLSWPQDVIPKRVAFVVFKGTLGTVEGGTIQDGVNYSASSLQSIGAGLNTYSKSFATPLAPLGATSTPSGTYTVLVAELFPSTYTLQTLKDWITGATTTEPHRYSSLTFNYIAQDVPEELTGLITSLRYTTRTILPGDAVRLDELTPHTTNPNIDDLWSTSLVQGGWPETTTYKYSLMMLFRGTYGALEGGTAVLGVNYDDQDIQRTGFNSGLVIWPQGVQTIGTFFDDMPSLNESSTEPGTYTLLLGTRDPKYAEWSTQLEADWFASGGTQGVPPKKYALLTFEYKKYHDCCSSVVFLPGIKATELFEEANQVWLPGLFNVDAGRLEMTISGDSVNSITVGDPVDEAYGLVEVYGSFFEFLESLKGTHIKDWQPLPYDWRYDVRDIVSTQQMLQDGSTLDLPDAVRNLAEKSLTGKVTLIAHSNGGLVGKALISELGTDAELVDRFIMVGTPQLGTPSAIGAFLHGHDQSLPGGSFPALFLSQSFARQLSKNMPGAYGLLPSNLYFEKVLDPVVSFDPNTDLTSPYRTAYGEFVGGSSANAEREQDDLYSFLLGIGDGRAQPVEGDLPQPLILNQALLDKASETHAVLDAWLPPTGLEAIQVVGWGRDTVKGINYTEFCSAGTGCRLYPEPEFSIEGDKTVVWRSAAALDGVSTYFFNLKEAGGSWTHTDLLAAPQVQSLIEGLVTDSSVTPAFISSAKPTPSAEKRLRISVHSPITIGIRDSFGRFTGVIQNPDPNSDVPIIIEEIPGTFYSEFGEGKYVGFPAIEQYEIVMNGMGEGFFTLNVEESEGGIVVQTISYSDVPVSATTKASLVIQDIQNSGELEVDTDGDGTTDAIIAPDGSELSLKEIIVLLKEKITSLDVAEKLKKNLLKRVENLEKKIEKKKQKNQKILERLEQTIDKKAAKGKIAATDASEILALLEELEAQSDSVTLDPELLQELKEKIEGTNMPFELLWSLLNRVDKLEKKTALVNTLARLTKAVVQKGEKGKIIDEDVEEIIELLGQVGSQL